MNALYAATVVKSLTSSAGWTVCGSVQNSVSLAPACAAPISAAPNGNGTRIESPLPPRLLGAQFGPTAKVAGKGDDGCGSVQNSVSLAPACAAPISAAPNGNGTRIEAAQ